jgi:signal transduction histidine kinase
LSNLTDELADQAQVLALLAADTPSIFDDASEADDFVRLIAGPLPTRIVLFDTEGRVLAASAPVTAEPNLSLLISGQVEDIRLSHFGLHGEIADVLVRVETPDHRLIGVIRLTRHMDSTIEQFRRLYLIVAMVLGGGLVLGVLFGWTLASNIQHPISELSRLINDMAAGQHLHQVPEHGPREIQALAHALNSLAEQIQSLEEARRRLLANLVHELGRPLGALLAAIEALQGGAAREAELRNELLGGMKGEIGRLRSLLADLAQLSDRTLGELELNLRSLNLDEWLPSVLAPWRETARAKGIAWQVDLPANLPTLHADADRLAQVLGNLLNNAIKYTPRGKAISLGVQVYEDAVRICVCDTGPGISPDQQALIFEPFHRAQTGRRFPQGMGLGLAIAREIAVAHGGQLKLERSSEEGSEFVLLLPRTGPSS